MKKDERIDLYQRAVEKWGLRSQENMLIEECAELIQAINKMNRTGDSENFFEELADVSIMIEQMITFHELEPVIRKYKEKKLKRLKELIENE